MYKEYLQRPFRDILHNAVRNYMRTVQVRPIEAIPLRTILMRGKCNTIRVSRG